MSDEAVPTKALHILVVDDDDDSRATIIEYLRSMGHDKITQCRDGAEAARILDRDATINFIISDWDMPMMNGLALLQRVRSQPSKAHLPYVIVTSPISQESEKVMMAAENLVDAYVIKPFRSEVLKDKINKVLQMPVHGPQKQVLVVDDDDDSRDTVIEYLKFMGFKDVHGEKNGKDGLEYVRANHAKLGLIISDWEMPEMSGIDLLREVKKEKNLGEIPFLMITSQSSLERIKVLQAAQANVDQYLLKPFRSDEIKKRIEVVLEKARVRTDVRNLVADGLRELDQFHYQKAQDFFEAALKLDADDDLALRGLGDVLLKTKGVQAALPIYKKAVDTHPHSATAFLRLATAYEQIGWLDKGISLLQIAVRQFSFRADLHFQLGRLYNKKGYPPLAKAEFERVLEMEPQHTEARLMLEMIVGKTEPSKE